MKKKIWLINIIVSALLIIPFYTFAQYGQMDQQHMNQQRIQMHEYMLKMQQQAINCLKAGNPEYQCRQQYRDSMRNMHNSYWRNNNDSYWDDNWDNYNRGWHHGCCNMMW